MFLDARNVPDGSEIESDVCIVGAGAAGITLARELAGQSRLVCLLESGGLEPDAETQALYRGEVVGFPYYPTDAFRLRYFGGTTNHWSGVCGPLQEIDFEARSWVPHSGWPFARSALEPYYRRAQEVCQLGPYRYDPEPWQGPDAPPLALDAERLHTVMNQLSPPTRFGLAYRDALRDAADVQTYLHANAVNLETQADGTRVSRVAVATLAGTRFAVRARQVVLATGAVENARLLLASRDRSAAGVGNPHDRVGRFFMEHLSVQGALFAPIDPALPMGLYGFREAQGVRAQGCVVPTEATLRDEELLSLRCYLQPASSRTAIRSVWFGLLRSGTGSTPEGLAERVVHALRQLDDLAIHGYRSFFEGSARSYAVVHHLEHAPNPQSRVTLGDERDALGLPRVRLDWRFGELERRTLRRAVEIFGREVGRAGLGRAAEVPDDPTTGWPPLLRGAWHQMGTTRMHTDPRHGVVDADARVHGLENLYLAGSSVFPTSGYMNPTLTIVALSLRLADHLKARRA